MKDKDIEWRLVREGNGKHKGEEERREVTIERVWIDKDIEWGLVREGMESIKEWPSSNYRESVNVRL